MPVSTGLRVKYGKENKKGKERNFVVNFKSIFDTAKRYLKDINDDRIVLLLFTVFILIFLARKFRSFVI